MSLKKSCFRTSWWVFLLTRWRDWNSETKVVSAPQTTQTRMTKQTTLPLYSQELEEDNRECCFLITRNFKKKGVVSVSNPQLFNFLPIYQRTFESRESSSWQLNTRTFKKKRNVMNESQYSPTAAFHSTTTPTRHWLNQKQVKRVVLERVTRNFKKKIECQARVSNTRLSDHSLPFYHYTNGPLSQIRWKKEAGSWPSSKEHLEKPKKKLSGLGLKPPTL